MPAYIRTRLIFKLLSLIILAVLMTPAVKAKDDLTTEIIRDKIELIRTFDSMKNL